MEKEEAIREIKRFMSILPNDMQEAMLTLVPELTESEDERMINELQGFLDSFGADYFGTGEWQKFHDWLEKQKEQNPAWSEEDEDAINGAIGILLDDNNPDFVFPEHSKLSVGEIVKRLKSFRPQPKPEWSEEDEKMLRTIISDGSRGVELDSKQISWLKSLRPSWKSCEGQKEAL